MSLMCKIRTTSGPCDWPPRLTFSPAVEASVLSAIGGTGSTAFAFVAFTGSSVLELAVAVPLVPSALATASRNAVSDARRKAIEESWMPKPGGAFGVLFEPPCLAAGQVKGTQLGTNRPDLRNLARKERAYCRAPTLLRLGMHEPGAGSSAMSAENPAPIEQCSIQQCTVG